MAKPQPTSAPFRSVLAKLRRSSAPPPPELEGVLSELKRMRPQSNHADVIRAYQVAEELHSGQNRKSGEAFITHPVEVARILASMGMDDVSVIAALLHDAVEDTDTSIEAIQEGFGEEVAQIIDGLTKIAKVRFVSLEHSKAENYRKMMVAMARDARVIIVKLADRLHNMRTLGSLAEHKQELKAAETSEIYVPLAARLGMQQIRSELEELAFKYRYPKRYAEVVDLVDKRQPERDQYIGEVIEELEAALTNARIKATISGRAKNYFSVYQKMVERGVAFDEIVDLVGVRVVVHDLSDCYTALGVAHTLWIPMPGKFKDYIAQPKFNLYQSLHTAVLGPGRKPLEIQIRTNDMHEMSEFGIAAHWRYKESAKKKQSTEDVPWLGEVVEAFRDTRDPADFMESLRLDLFADEVFVFTPKGDVHSFPTGATPLDFAYAIHTEIGHRCAGARLNGRLVPLATQLEIGDVVEVITTKSPDAAPKQDWLNIVKTSRARGRIKQWLAAHRREESTKTGQESFARILKREGISIGQLDDEAWRTLFSETRTSGQETLYEGIGENKIPAAAVSRILRAIFFEDVELEPTVVALPKRRKRAISDAGVIVASTEDIASKLARCCNPVPGDNIFGFITRGKGVSVHRSDCPNTAALRAQTGRVVDVEWDMSQTSTYTVSLQVAAMDRTGLLKDVTDAITEAGVMILSSQSWVKPDGTARLRFGFEIADVAHLDHIVRAVNRVGGVFDIYRVLPLSARK